MDISDNGWIIILIVFILFAFFIGMRSVDCSSQNTTCPPRQIIYREPVIENHTKECDCVEEIKQMKQEYEELKEVLE